MQRLRRKRSDDEEEENGAKTVYHVSSLSSGQCVSLFRLPLSGDRDTRTGMTSSIRCCVRAADMRAIDSTPPAAAVVAIDLYGLCGLLILNPCRFFTQLPLIL